MRHLKGNRRRPEIPPFLRKFREDIDDLVTRGAAEVIPVTVSNVARGKDPQSLHVTLRAPDGRVFTEVHRCEPRRPKTQRDGRYRILDGMERTPDGRIVMNLQIERTNR